MTNRKSMTRCSVLFSLAVALGACSSSSKPNGGAGSTGTVGGTTGSVGGTSGAVGGTTGAAGGHGGTVGSNGGTTGSTGGISGTGGAPVNCGNVPPCVATFLSNCPLGGTCIQQTSGSVATGDFSTRECFSSGVKRVTTEMVDATSGSFVGVTTVTKNGTICYSLSEVVGAGGAGGAANESQTIMVKNGAGTVVATIMNTEMTASDGTTTTAVLVTCDGMTYNVTDQGQCGTSGNGGSSGSFSCTAGTCGP